jgi:hypothetical protein
MMGHFPQLDSSDTLEGIVARYNDHARSLRSAESADEFRTPQEPNAVFL